MPKQILKKLFLSLVLFLLWPNVSRATVLFEDNFNSSAEWAPRNKIAGNGPLGYTGESTSPANWPWWNNTEQWNPYYTLDPIAGSQPAVQISGSASYGLSSGNKAFVAHNESRAGGDGWGSDGMFEKYFASEMPELYVQLKVKFSPTFIWADPGTQSDSIKMFRIERYHNNNSAPRWLGAGNTLNFDDGNNSPNYIINSTYKTEYGTGFTMYVSDRCTPNAYDYIVKDDVIYRCITSHTSSAENTPPNATYWSFLRR